VRELTDGSFGVVIAYLVPGLVALSAVSDYVPVVDTWLGVPANSALTVGGFLYGTLGATGAGLTLNAVRWLALDRLHHATGLVPPTLDFSRLQQHLGAHHGAVQNHYRYYQFYGHMLLALLLVPLAPRTRSAWLAAGWTGWLAGGLLLIVYFLASRDTLQKYYARTAAMLVSPTPLQESSHDERLAPRTSETSDPAAQVRHE
jgi:hypothetical protein